MPATVIITGGGFQDSEGNALAGGTLYLKLNHDAFSDSTQTTLICAGKEVSYILDSSGNVPAGSTAWPNDLIVDAWLANDPRYTTVTTNYILASVTGTGEINPGPSGVYTGSTPLTFLAGVNNGLVGQVVTISGFSNPTNNGRFVIVASTLTTITVNNDASIGETNTGLAVVVANIEQSPNITYYEARVETAEGELAWGPNNVYIYSTPSPYNIGTLWLLTNPH
jgi:hypothetical protein